MDCYVELFEDSDFRGKKNTIEFGNDVPTLDKSDWNFNDKMSSLRYVVPTGWECQLTEHRDYQGWSFPLRGRGEIQNFNPNDQLTAVRWLQLPEQSPQALVCG
jgi:hypothetical protein